jgi:hypothetical protein
MRLAGSALVGLAMMCAACTGGAGGMVQELQLPADVDIVAPGPTVPPELAAFSGVWGGRWQGSTYGQPWALDALVVVERIAASGAANGRYIIGDSPYQRAGSGRFAGTIANNRLTWTVGQARYEFVLGENGLLKGGIYRGGVQDIADISMTKMQQVARRTAAAITIPALQLPEGTRIVPPDPAVPAHISAFAGKWGGIWNNVLPSLLVVESVDGRGRASVIYVWGDAPAINTQAGFRRYQATITNNVLAWGSNVKFEFTLLPDGTLFGERTVNGYPAGTADMRKDGSEQVARPASSHWLMGVWKGQVQGYATPEGPLRTLNVIDVKPDGTATGAWNIGTGMNFHDTTVSVNGDAVSIVTSARSIVALQRSGDVLKGIFTLANGRSYPVELSRAAP